MSRRLPIVPVDRPTDLAGAQNGKLDPKLLVPVNPVKARGWSMHHLAARAWEAMRAQAWREGVLLSVSGNPYRDYAGQRALFMKRYTSTAPTTIDKVGRVWNGVRYYRTNGAAAAVPGTSNHGWGLAVDVAIDADGDEGFEWPPKSVNSTALTWMINNAHKWGFSFELQSEPWHLRYVAGDNIPQAVLQAEGGGTTPATPTPQTHTVVAGDTWWKLAQRYLGGGTRFRTLQKMNPGKRMHPGVVLVVGEVAAPAPVTPPPSMRRVVVKRGDSYWKLAHVFYGKGSRWPEIAAANNNRTLHPGMEVLVP